ncbi:MAG: bacillithiol biosynthesis deacetylase BshB1 [Ignavibacteria bacterium]|nr:bacillithiol biosynthesis deacetylase BshB1 [Ignavibacteria bacterium]
MKLDALFFAAHPDDAELNCGGTILNLTGAGKNVGIADLTKGELSTRGTPALRKKETAAASKLMKIKVRENLSISDGNIQINEANKKRIIAVIRKYRPEIIFAPFPNDRHPDHIYTGNLIKESVFYSGLRKVVTESLKEFRPRRIFFYKSAYDIPVSFIMDISGIFKKKLEVIKCYSTQFYNPQSNEPETFISSKLFVNEIETRARYFGFKIGAEFGEPFYSIEPLKVTPENIFEI